MAHLTFRYRQTHQRILTAVEKLTDEQLRWRPLPTRHSIGFVLWHLGRYADLLQASLPRMTPVLARRLGPSRQIWDTQELAVQWNWPAAELGLLQTGKQMADERASQLVLPHKDLLLGYVRRSFAAAEQASEAVDDEQFLVQVAEELGIGPVTVGHSLLAHLVHDNQHLGEIQCLCSILPDSPGFDASQGGEA